jgi:uncharacterized protein YutE (UPF0331/DUF86 family)
MVSQATLARKISYIESKLERLRQHAGVTKEAFLQDADLQDIVLHNLQLAIQACIDLGAHIVSDEGWGSPGSFSEVFRKLEEHGVISKELSEHLVEMVGFRNRIVHGYEDVDLSIVYEVWKQRIGDIEEFISRVGDRFGI